MIRSMIWVLFSTFCVVSSAAEAVIEKANIAPEISLSEQKASNYKDSNLHPIALSESWYISGVIENEQAERYAYYFIVHRLGEQFSYYTQLISLANGTILFNKTESAKLSLETRQGINLKIGDGFLRYNEINDSWTFGVADKQGFNLRVESLQVGRYSISHLKSLSFYTLQSKRVNGQITLASSPIFVTSSNAWLAHQWQDQSHAQLDMTVERLLCRSIDNQGMMLVKAYQGKNVVFSQADLLDSHGESHPVSQFSLLSQKAPLSWQVKLFSPPKTLEVKTEHPLQALSGNKTTRFYLGLTHEQGKPDISGVCTIIKEQVALANSPLVTESSS